MTNQTWDTVWCYFRNALHSAYREICHIGQPQDPHARALAPPSYSKQANKCRANRHRLKSSVPFRSVSRHSTTGYIEAYKALTDLTPEDLSFLFRNASWQDKYGGEKWATITDTIIELGRAIDARNLPACPSLCSRLKGLQHNSGPLVPTRDKWEQDPWQREKWPELCEKDETNVGFLIG